MSGAINIAEVEEKGLLARETELYMGCIRCLGDADLEGETVLTDVDSELQDDSPESVSLVSDVYATENGCLLHMNTGDCDIELTHEDMSDPISR
jgi:hypothetical protein